MKVKELIEALKQLSQEAEVVAETGEGEKYLIRNITINKNKTEVLLDE